MRKIAARLLFFAMIGATMPPGFRAKAQNAGSQTQAQDEKEQCINNLKIIGAAIREYQKDNKDIPNWLSDLVPKYLDDANILICPVCKRTGRTEINSLADPKLPSSYLYEFCPLPLGSSAPGDPTATRREWKRRQMGLVGSVVPIVRCRQHGVALNLSFDGKIYESPMNWETMFTNIVDPASLSSERIFSNETKGSGTAGYPKRDPKAKSGELDLTPFYNARLTDSWHGSTGNDLSALPCGLQTFAGVEFDVRGIIQLGGKPANAKKFPTEVTNIKVHQKCHSLNFLYSAAFGGKGEEGKELGAYVVHYAANQMRLEIPIYYGRDVRDWHTTKDEPPAPKEMTVAWTGANGTSRAAGQSIRLFKTTWVNVAPDVEIESVDIVGGMTVSSPFVIAITAE